MTCEETALALLSRTSPGQARRKSKITKGQTSPSYHLHSHSFNFASWVPQNEPDLSCRRQPSVNEMVIFLSLPLSSPCWLNNPSCWCSPYWSGCYSVTRLTHSYPSESVTHRMERDTQDAKRRHRVWGSTAQSPSHHCGQFGEAVFTKSVTKLVICNHLLHVCLWRKLQAPQDRRFPILKKCPASFVTREMKM